MTNQRRLTKELRDFKNTDELVLESTEELKRCRINLTGSAGTLYQNEKFTLQFKFDESYPLESPEVLFIG